VRVIFIAGILERQRNTNSKKTRTNLSNFNKKKNRHMWRRQNFV